MEVTMNRVQSGSVQAIDKFSYAVHNSTYKPAGFGTERRVFFDDNTCGKDPILFIGESKADIVRHLRAKRLCSFVLAKKIEGSICWSWRPVTPKKHLVEIVDAGRGAIQSFGAVGGIPSTALGVAGKAAKNCGSAAADAVGAAQSYKKATDKKTESVGLRVWWLGGTSTGERVLKFGALADIIAFEMDDEEFVAWGDAIWGAER